MRGEKDLDAWKRQRFDFRRIDVQSGLRLQAAAHRRQESLRRPPDRARLAISSRLIPSHPAYDLFAHCVRFGHAASTSRRGRASPCDGTTSQASRIASAMCASEYCCITAPRSKADARHSVNQRRFFVLTERHAAGLAQLQTDLRRHPCPCRSESRRRPTFRRRARRIGTRHRPTADGR